MKRRILGLALGACLLVGSFGGVANAESNILEKSQLNSSTSSREFSQFLGFGYIDGTGVRLRQGPSTSDTILGILTDGERVAVTNKGYENWFYVYSSSLDKGGYVYIDYVVVDDPA